MDKKRRKAVILEDLIPLDISFIKRAFDLKWVGKRSREINLYSSNPITGANEFQASIFISINIDTASNDYIDLQFILNEKHIRQRIELIIKRDNLNKGCLHYFKCPVTGRQKRKLFLYNGQFVSKQAIDNPHYKSQLQSRKQRNSIREIKRVLKLQKTASKANKRYFMKFYAGEPTKRYIKILMASEDLKGLW